MIFLLTTLSRLMGLYKVIILKNLSNSLINLLWQMILDKFLNSSEFEV